MIINCNVNRENDSYLPSRSTVSNSESFETRASNTELSKASGSKTSLEDSYEKNFEKTMTADQAGFTFQNPVSFTFTKIRSLFGCFKRSLMVKYYDYGFLEKWFKQARKFFFLLGVKCLTKLNLE